MRKRIHNKNKILQNNYVIKYCEIRGINKLVLSFEKRYFGRGERYFKNSISAKPSFFSEISLPFLQISFPFLEIYFVTACIRRRNIKDQNAPVYMIRTYMIYHYFYNIGNNVLIIKYLRVTNLLRYLRVIG